MHAFRIESLAICHLEQRLQNVAAYLRRARLPSDTKTIATTGNLDIEAAFDLPQVFIKLAAKVGQALVIGRLEDQVPRCLDRIQST
jgi:hypothetical protein